MELGTGILTRCSPREYTHGAVPGDIIRNIFSHARWAQSSFNEQPWSFIIATRNDGAAREQLEQYLDEGNAYAKEAWILGMSVAKKTFDKTGKPNRHCWHDVGAASQLIALRAWELGVNTRFMAGFDYQRARELCPESHEPVAMFVIGMATEAARVAASQNRSRRETESFLFSKKWSEPFDK